MVSGSCLGKVVVPSHGVKLLRLTMHVSAQIEIALQSIIITNHDIGILYEGFTMDAIPAIEQLEEPHVTLRG